MNNYQFSVVLTNGQRLMYTVPALSKAQGFRSVVDYFYNTLFSVEFIGLET